MMKIHDSVLIVSLYALLWTYGAREWRTKKYMETWDDDILKEESKQQSGSR